MKRRRSGCPPRGWYPNLVADDPARGEEVLVRTLRCEGGNVRRTAAALGVHWMRVYEDVYRFGLRGLPRKIREAHAARFRLPAA